MRKVYVACAATRSSIVYSVALHTAAPEATFIPTQATESVWYIYRHRGCVANETANELRITRGFPLLFLRRQRRSLDTYLQSFFFTRTVKNRTMKIRKYIPIYNARWVFYIAA